LKTQAKILIIQTAFIGDVILATPLIEALKRELPDSQIHFLTIPKAVNIIENNPHVTKIIEYDKHKRDKGILGLYHFGRKIKREAYDICLTPHRSLRSAYLTRKTRAQKRIGFDRSAWKGAFTDIIIYPGSKHEIEASKVEGKIVAPDLAPALDQSLHATRGVGLDVEAVDGLPRTAFADHLCLEQTDNGLGQRIVVGVTRAADRVPYAGPGHAFGITDRQVLTAPVAVMDEALGSLPCP